MPVLKLPQKSHSTSKSPARRHIYIFKDRETPSSKKWCKNFTELRKKTFSLKLTNWVISQCETNISFKLFEEPFIVPKYEIVVDDSLGFTCFIYGWLLPEDHFLYKTDIRTISNVGIPELLRFVTTDICICPGIMNSINDGLLLHAVPRKIDLNSHDNSMRRHIFKRSKDCLLLHNNTAVCVECNSFDSIN